MRPPLWIYLFFILLLFPVKGFSAQPINKIVAVVGDEILTLYELDQMGEPFYQKFIKQDAPPEEVEALKNKIRRDLLDQWIEDTVIGLEAKKYGIKVTDAELEQFMKEELKQAEAKGLNLSEVKEKLKDRLMKIKFIQLTVREKIVIPEEDLKRAYEAKVKNFDPTPKYLLEILIVKEDLLVKELYEQILRGKGLQEINQANKEHTLYLRETFKEEELDRGVLEELKKLKPGEVTGPLKRGEAFQIIRLVKKEAGQPPAFEEVKKELYEELFQKKAQEYLEKWIKELKESKFVKVNL